MYRLWSLRFALDESLRSQACQVKRPLANHGVAFANPPTHSTITGICEPNQVSRISYEPKEGRRHELPRMELYHPRKNT